MSGMIWFLAGCLSTASIWIVTSLRQRCCRQKRLLSLTAYLEAASCGRETVLARKEDAFSLLEDELYKTVSELRIARECAQQERLRQADDLADIAHQLKTPLTSLSLMTQLLSAEASQEQLEYIARIDAQLNRLDWLTSALLTMSRLDAGAVAFTALTLSFEELAARALEPVEQLLAERSQSVTVTGKEISVFCDPHWTAEALTNLIKNCSEHAPASGQITVTAAATALYLQLTVEDSGPGFDPNEIPHLFRRFYRGKNCAKDSIGIGLALCRAITEGQDGMIRAENRPEGGARFLLRFYLK